MPDEALISEIENLLTEVVELGGQNERSQIVPNLTVQDANPTNLDGFVIVSDDRDGDNILAKKVGSVIYADNDLVNLMFLRGGEAIAFQQGSESANSGIWEIAANTSTDIYYDKGRVGIGTNEPFQNVAAGTADYTGEGLHVEAAVGAGRYIVEGTSAEINMIDGGGAADDKILTFVVDGGIGKYVSYNDNLTIRTDNILTVDMGDGNVGIRTAAPDMPLQVGNGADTLGFTDTNNTVFAGPDTSAGRLILEGTVQADMVLIDGGAAANDKAMQLLTVAGQTEFRALTDVAGVQTDNILVMDHGTGDIGIGTAGPDAKLDILDTSTQLRLTHTDGSKYIDFTLDTNHNWTATPSSTGQVIFQPTTNSVDFFQVRRAAATIAFNVDTTNLRVGIGTDAPTSTFHVTRSQSILALFENTIASASNQGGFIILSSNDGAAQASGDRLGGFAFRGQTDASTNNNSAAVNGFADGAWAVGDAPGRLEFQTTPDGATARTTRMVIKNDGLIGINGVTSPSTELDIGAGAMEYEEMTAPAAGAANTARLFAQDNGAGKTQLAVRFNTGAIQILATEP